MTTFNSFQPAISDENCLILTLIDTWIRNLLYAFYSVFADWWNFRLDLKEDKKHCSAKIVGEDVTKTKKLLYDPFVLWTLNYV